jgi:mono/diheme cytochrome c family protein
MRRLIAAIAVVLLLAGGGFYALTAPRPIDAAALPEHTPDPENGERIFHAGGCASCHSAPAGEECDAAKTGDKRALAGGRCLKTRFGTFYAPNISPDPQAGIGGWSEADFVNAMLRGIAPSGAHYYPAFPYTSYRRMRVRDVLDLKAFLDTLPAVKSEVPAHDLAWPYRLRRGVGLWKRLYLDGEQFSPDPDKSEKLNRGAYLVEGPGHCGECHTPRDALGGLRTERKLAGAPSPEGEGRVPNITPHESGIGDWSEADIAYALESGFTPSFDTFGGRMVAVQENMAQLPDADRAAIAAYLKSLPPVASRAAENGGDGG